MSGLGWYLKRLRVMSLPELAHRIGDALALQRMRLRAMGSRRVIATAEWREFEFCSSLTRQLPQCSFIFDLSPPDQARLLEGHWPALGFDWKWSPGAEVWHVAPDSGRPWPLKFFGSIRYRPGNETGDIRVAWEPARLQQLVSLALLAEANPKQRATACHLIETILRDWVTCNPPLIGIHYVSAMECALRLIAVCHALDIIRGHIANREQTWGSLLSIVKTHAPLIGKRLSTHSSAGNHTLAEAAGLVYTGVLFPELEGAAHWEEAGLRVLRQESQRQILSDGGGIEQAFRYHVFNVDLLGLVSGLLRYKKTQSPPEVESALVRGRRFLSEVAVVATVIPPVGDGDDGYALSRHLRISLQEGTGVRGRSARFPEAGYTILRSDSEPRVKVLIDHGPLGMPPSFGHGHADALSVLVWVDESELFADTGTYGYGLDGEWRRFFRSTRAHNTVVVENQDQARQESAFMWSSPYRVEIVREDYEDDHIAGRVLMRHDGYCGLGATHWRGVSLSRDGLLVVWDMIAGIGNRDIELNWHLGMEPIDGDLSDGVISLPRGLKIEVQGGRTAVVRGSMAPNNGWRSTRYGKREQSPTISVRYLGELPHEYVTVVSLGTASSRPASELQLFKEWYKWAQAA